MLLMASFYARVISVQNALKINQFAGVSQPLDSEAFFQWIFNELSLVAAAIAVESVRASSVRNNIVIGTKSL